MDSPVSADDPHSALRRVLENLETCLLTPVISGELEAWTKALWEAWVAAADEVRRHFDHYHREQFARISTEDPELMPRVEQLQAEGEAIRQEIVQLSAAIERLAPRAEKVEPHEGRLDAQVEALSGQGIALINRIRKQEVALQTWFSEAFNRDRGVAAD
jgi:hypothetical protein